MTETRSGIHHSADFKLAGFRLWVHGYAYGAIESGIDSNWLRLTASCGGSGAIVEISGTYLDAPGFQRFRNGLADLHAMRVREAILEGYEPNLVARVVATDRTGHLALRVDITPDHLAQAHWFEFEIDQSYLPAAIAALDTLLVRLPIRDTTTHGV